MHSLNAWGQWAVQFLQHIASLPRSTGQWDPSNTPPHCLAVGLVHFGNSTFCTPHDTTLHLTRPQHTTTLRNIAWHTCYLKLLNI